MASSDVHVRITHSGLHIAIDGVMDLRRTFWGVEGADGPAEVRTVDGGGGTVIHSEDASPVDARRPVEAAPVQGYQAVMPELCSWTIEVPGSASSNNGPGSGTCSKGLGSGTSRSSGNTGGPRLRPPGKTLTLHLALPPPSREEITYKKGERDV